MLGDPDVTAEDDERMEWYEDFDPAVFDVAKATAKLQRMFRGWSGRYERRASPCTLRR